MYDLNKASETIKDSYFTHESITTEQIKKELTNYLDELVEEINNDPLYFFRDNHQFWRKLDKVALAEEQQQQLDNVA
ncbi:MAG: hypothetical protein QNJ72_07700 [Pleurocapsa sp. MO_226.B13]|nr:hypothetical protein [Pleurocapsa sp. MO_226.B13]